MDIDNSRTTIFSDDYEEDLVNKPPHYQSSTIECIDAMEAMSLGSEGQLNSHQAYCWQNAFKYLWRFVYKNGVEDLKKCRWYLDRLITSLEGGVR